jgi:tripartite-type tricarboxylate transporter receptor subunit TctC
MEETKRTRMNVNLTAKGQAQWDVTAEYATPEETKAALSAAIDAVREVIREKGLVEAGSVA